MSFSVTNDRSFQQLTFDAGSGEVLVPITPNVADEVNRDSRTIKRWLKDPTKKFPQTIRLNGRLYVRRSDFETWKRNLFEAALAS